MHIIRLTEASLIAKGYIYWNRIFVKHNSCDFIKRASEALKTTADVAYMLPKEVVIVSESTY